jgi:hypothetical protein
MGDSSGEEPNLASELEKLSYEFATGKNDGQPLKDFARAKLAAP